MFEARILGTQFNTRQTLVMLLHTDPDLDIRDIEEVYYPYVRMRFKLIVGKKKWIAGKVIKYVDCIIDRVSGTAYDTIYDKNSDSTPFFETVEIDEEDALDIELSIDDCHKKGHDFALKQYIAKAKLMFTPEMKIIEEDEFYKKFYVVTCQDKDGMSYFIMVDAVDGGISILDHEKHIDTLAKLGDMEGLRYLAGDSEDEYYDDEEEDEVEDVKEDEDVVVEN